MIYSDEIFLYFGTYFLNYVNSMLSILYKDAVLDKHSKQFKSTFKLCSTQSEHNLHS